MPQPFHKNLLLLLLGAIQISADSTFGLFQTLPPYPDSTLTLCSRPSHPTLTRQGVISIDIDFFNDNLLLEHKR